MWFFWLGLLTISWFQYVFSAFTPAKFAFPVAIKTPSLTVVENQVIVVGGVDNNGDFMESKYILDLSNVDNVKPDTLEWTSENFDSDVLVNITTSVGGQISVSVNDGVYIFREDSSSFLIYNSSTSEWMESNVFNQADNGIDSLSSPCVTYDDTTNTIIVFGYNGNNSYLLTYMHETHSWGNVFGLLEVVLKQAQCATYNGRIFIFGGQLSSGLASNAVYSFFSQWSLDENIAMSRFNGQAIVIDQYALLLGGTMDDSQSFANTEVYDLVTRKKKGFAPSMFRSRHLFGAVYHVGKKLLIVVGGSNDELTQMTWEFLDFRQTTIDQYLISASISSTTYIYDVNNLEANLTVYGVNNYITTDNLQEAYHLATSNGTTVVVITDLTIEDVTVLDIHLNSSINIMCRKLDPTKLCEVYIINGIFLDLQVSTTVTEAEVIVTGFDLTAVNFGRVYYFSMSSDKAIDVQLNNLEINLHETADIDLLYHSTTSNSLGKLEMKNIIVNGNENSMSAIVNVYGNLQLTNVWMSDVHSNSPPIEVIGGSLIIEDVAIMSSVTQNGSIIWMEDASSITVTNLTCKDTYGQRSSCLWLASINTITLSEVNIEGGVCNVSSISILYPIMDVTISNINVAQSYGSWSAGIFIYQPFSPVTITNIVMDSVFADLVSSLFIFSSSLPISISGVTITNANADIGGISIYEVFGPLTLVNVIINNAVGHSVGAISADNIHSPMNVSADITETRGNVGAVVFSNVEEVITVSNTHITNVVSFFGALYCDGCKENLYVINTSFNNCTNPESFGGGLAFNSVEDDVGVYCDNCIFLNSSALIGGGLYLGNPYGHSYVVRSQFYNNIADKLGGGIVVNGGYLDVEDSIFQNNYADSGGGIAFSPVTEQTLVIRNSQFLNNVAASNGGGVGIISVGNYSVSDSFFYGNRAKISGGGFYDGNGYASCRANISYMLDSKFDNNIAQKGAGMFVRGCNTTVENTIFVNNTVIGIGGGLLFDAASGKSVARKLTLQNNKASRHGGGIAVTGGNVIITETNILNNEASDNGGGLYVRAAKGWTISVFVNRSTITNNQAMNGGGVSVEADIDFYDWHDEAEVTMIDVTISDNEGSLDGGGIFISKGSLQTQRCTIESNQAGNGSGLSYNSGWYRDDHSTYHDNVANIMGGGIYTIAKEMELTGTTMLGNSAKYGGGIFVENCLSYSSNGVMFFQNKAQYSGGAMQVPVSCEWCMNCNYQSNEAAFGADQSTEPVELKCEWKIPKQITSVTKLSPKCGLYDAFGSLLTSYSQSAAAYVNYHIKDNTSLNLSGATNPTFVHNGIAQFELYLIPLSDWKYTDFETEVTLNISTNVNPNFKKSYTITFHNSIWTVPDGILAMSILLGCIVIITALVFAALTWKYSKQAIIRAATLNFLAVILTGALILGVFVIIAPLAPQHVHCVSQIWLLHFGFALLVCPIAGKTYRIFAIFMTAKQLQTVNLTTKRLSIYFLLLPGIALFIYLICWTLSKGWDTHFVVGDDGVIYEECQYNSVFVIISLVTAILFLLWIVQLAVSVRDVPRNFNESRWLGASVYTFSIVFLFVIPLAAINSVSFVARRAFVSVGCAIATEAVLLFLFATKFAKIWTGEAAIKQSKSNYSTTTTSEDTTPTSTRATEMGYRTGTETVTGTATTGTGKERITLNTKI